MSLFNDASLIITPNAYKEGKIFSIVPSDGSGDLSVVRATTATDVNSAGLIEDTPYNLLQRSEEFENAVWLKLNSSITSNQATAPNGTLTADKLIENNTTDIHQLFYNGIPAASRIIGNFVFTVYAKKLDSNRNISISASSLGNGRYCIIDLQNNTILSNNILTGTGGDIVSANVIENISLNDNWIKISVLFVTSGTNYLPSIGITNGNNFSYLGNGTSSIYIWGAQLVAGSSAREYFPTTDRLNVPRLDYTNSTCPSILVEPQRTNLVLNSNNLSSWILFGTSALQLNSTTSPSGNTDASKLVPTSSNGYIISTISTIASVTYVFSVYVKSATSSNVNSNIYAVNSGNATNFTATNDWQRISLVFTSTSTSTSVYIGGHNSLSTGEDLFIWGAQVEAGSYATSYIPTVASTVTRNADVISKTGISSLIGQTEGVLYFEGSSSDNGAALIYVNRNLQNSLWLVRNATTNTINGRIYHNSNVIQFTTSNAVNGVFKVALAYKSGESTMYVNGIQIGTNTNILSFSAALTTLENNLTSAFIGGNQQVNINNVSVFPTRLTNAELAQLTTL